MDAINPFPKGPIKNLVVLVMENRSFDSVLGRLKWDGMNPAVDGLNGTEFNEADGKKYYVTKATISDRVFDPLHFIWDMTKQIYSIDGDVVGDAKPEMKGFARSGFGKSGDYGAIVTMEAHGPDTMPVTYALAQQFSIIEDWFASFPGSTYPNRNFVHCATSAGQVSNAAEATCDDSRAWSSGVDCHTVFDSLREKGYSWKIYTSNYNPWSEVPAENKKVTTNFFKSQCRPANMMRVNRMSDLHVHARAGRLAPYTFIDPQQDVTDNHPPADLRAGEKLVKELYESLRASPQWNQTLFLITYDENGGFYDHVSPPTGVPAPDNIPADHSVGDFKFDRLGARVPAILISPLVPKGGVFRSTVPGRHYEHSSISATIKRIFDLPSFLTKRDAWALPFDNIASLPTPRTDCPVTMPDPYAH
ncbi:hypothetical protein HK105_204449 [Polyrhizophydium stewartii]|uniref:Phospholipase C n=1 Tax=Polyrhizophydium stewartii TaxID=2732419 RepID=A0ABR4N937_9FUNG